LRILVAEDERGSRRLVTAMLDGLSCEIDIAENGIEAVDAVRLMRYDLVLMDLNMPRLGGIEAATAIRRMAGRRGATPIVVITGDDSEETVQRCRAAGINEVIPKPIGEEVLLAAIRRWAKPHLTPQPMVAERSQVGGDLIHRLGAKVFQEMASHFREDGPRYVAELDEALSAGRLEEGGAHAHRLAGAARAFAMEALANGARAVEDACRESDLPRAQRLFDDVGVLLRQALQLLEEEWERLDAAAGSGAARG
jgi:CheY-like chemotaxis protein/HPt (histidine-containing phosphotransfer) domain-containing protein